MMNIHNCPSSLAEGYETYSPKSIKTLLKVSHILDFNIDEFRNMGDVAAAMHRISVSGVQEKFPAYDLLNTSLHVNGDDFGLDGGLSPNIVRSDVYESTGHPCRLDFERFGERIGIKKPRVGRILDRYMQLPESAETLIRLSFLNDKMKRYYQRIIQERLARFRRASEYDGN